MWWETAVLSKALGNDTMAESDRYWIIEFQMIVILLQ